VVGNVPYSIFTEFYSVFGRIAWSQVIVVTCDDMSANSDSDMREVTQSDSNTDILVGIAPTVRHAAVVH
jgi:hypothetical protein